MSVPMEVIANVYEKLDRIKTLAEEVESVIGFAPETREACGTGGKCRRIRQDIDWVHRQLSDYIGSGGEA
jgi:hypothetical protein